MGEALFSILVLATMVQFITEIVKGWLPAKVLKYIRPPIIAAVLGVLVALVFNIDAFSIAGYRAAVPYVGCILTGIILSAGSAAIHELIAKIRDTRDTR